MTFMKSRLELRGNCGLTVAVSGDGVALGVVEGDEFFSICWTEAHPSLVRCSKFGLNPKRDPHLPTNGNGGIEN